jgi:hypothetical protein
MLIGRGFVGCRLGSFVESPGSIVDSVGSNVVFPGSFALKRRVYRDKPGKLSQIPRQPERECRVYRDICHNNVAEYATTQGRCRIRRGSEGDSGEDKVGKARLPEPIRFFGARKPAGGETLRCRFRHRSGEAPTAASTG